MPVTKVERYNCLLFDPSRFMSLILFFFFLFFLKYFKKNIYALIYSFSVQSLCNYLIWHVYIKSCTFFMTYQLHLSCFLKETLSFTNFVICTFTLLFVRMRSASFGSHHSKEEDTVVSNSKSSLSASVEKPAAGTISIII